MGSLATAPKRLNQPGGQIDSSSWPTTVDGVHNRGPQIGELAHPAPVPDEVVATRFTQRGLLSQKVVEVAISDFFGLAGLVSKVADEQANRLEEPEADRAIVGGIAIDQ